MTVQVAFITGAARGQGRSHAVRARPRRRRTIHRAVDICSADSRRCPTRCPSPGRPRPDGEGGRGRGAADRRPASRTCATSRGLRSALDAGIAELGGPADRAGQQPQHRRPAARTRATRTSARRHRGQPDRRPGTPVRIAIPAMIEADRGGSIVIRQLDGGPAGVRDQRDRPARLHRGMETGVVGLMRGWKTNYLGPHNIRSTASHRPPSARRWRPTCRFPPSSRSIRRSPGRSNSLVRWSGDRHLQRDRLARVGGAVRCQERSLPGRRGSR